MLEAFNNKRNFEQAFQLFSSGLIFVNNSGEIVELILKWKCYWIQSVTELIGMNVMRLFELLNSTHHEKKEFMIKLSKMDKRICLPKFKRLKGN